MSRVSVLMPIFNSEKYVAEAIESMLKQTYADFELFAIYDCGTTDRTPDILNYYSAIDKRIKPINIGENNGIVKALNYGIEIANSEYIARMDADDICLPERLEKQVSLLDSNEQIDIIGTFISAFGEVSNDKIKSCEDFFNYKIPDELPVWKMLEGPCVLHPSVMFRKKFIIEVGGYNNEFKAGEDYDLWVRAFINGYKISNIPEKLIKYRMHYESKSYLESMQSNSEDIALKCKLNYINGLNNGIYNYLIWGASDSGKSAYDRLNRYLPEANLKAYVDKYKVGTFNGVDIIEPECISKTNCDFIFIATISGRFEVEEYLNSKGYKKAIDYWYML